MRGKFAYLKNTKYKDKDMLKNLIHLLHEHWTPREYRYPVKITQAGGNR
jgi:hypothetical protein